MTLLDLYKKDLPDVQNTHAEIKRTRSEFISEIKKRSRFDVIIAGGGIQGAVFARLAAFNGLKVLLLEADDYGSGTSGRTSKMAHGGLRYLEYFDFKQVNEGVRSRQELLESAPHLVKSHPFLIPIYEGETFKRLKLNIGLTIYEWFAADKQRKHSWLEDAPEISAMLNPDKTKRGFFQFYDGIMHDVRLVLENIYAARQEGALCLNYARVDSIYQNNRDTEVSWTDTLTHQKFTSITGVVVNTAGPWAPTLGRVNPPKNFPAVRYSQGTHLFFKKEWNHPALLIPLPGRGRNYFVWPHYGGTMVGTTERELSKPDFEPLPDKDEVCELLERLKNDLPGSGLNRESLYWAFSGIRTLASSSGRNQTFKLSRRHIWHYAQGVLTLLGGKFTSAAWTASEGLRRVFGIAGLNRKVVPLNSRPLPGAFNLSHEIESFRKLCREKNVPDAVCESCIRRLGSRVKFLSELDPELKLITPSVLLSDLRFALLYEQAETLRDLISRRLDLESMPGNGIPEIEALTAKLEEERPETDWRSQAESYKEYVASVTKTIYSA